ncbi:MAG TPA: aldehyde dehydrogenase family protein [Anaeromyxobacteraceae bacterium]|nr:aldehyde dehydrogenase family protein [Anaeromyxobacteraceae bacterium]
MNENLVREIVKEVLSRMGRPPSLAPDGDSKGPRRTAVARRFGVFEDVDTACAAASEAFSKLKEAGVSARVKVVEIVKRLSSENAAAWAKLELEETRIGRLDHKIEKLKILALVPGVEFLHPDGRSGDHGITLEEYTPFGVIGAVTPSTHSIPTLSGNIISMVAGGNAVVFNPHPAAARCAVHAVRAYNEAIFHELGIDNLACVIESPTIEGFQALARNPEVSLLAVTGGPGVVRAAMGSGKRAICAGPGNPPVLVDETVDLDKAARKIVQGASYDNNLLCIGEKEVFVLEEVANRLLEALERAGGHRLKPAELERLTRAAFTVAPGTGGGCARASLNRELLGQDAPVLGRAAGLSVRPGTEILFAETEADHPFVEEEQMMPMLPVVRVRSVEEGIAAAARAEHGYKHTALIHSHDVSRMTAMARALDTTLFVKNGPSMAGLGLGGEGYLSYTIATPTGEGVTNPKTFTRLRRCVMVDNLRIY